MFDCKNGWIKANDGWYFNIKSIVAFNQNTWVDRNNHTQFQVEVVTVSGNHIMTDDPTGALYELLIELTKKGDRDV